MRDAPRSRLCSKWRRRLGPGATQVTPYRVLGLGRFETLGVVAEAHRGCAGHVPTPWASAEFVRSGMSRWRAQPHGRPVWEL